MDEENVAIRLKGFIDSQGLSHSQFADNCGIPRPSLSQILSGRNKKISDVIIGQIHRSFPSLSVLWLLFGEGSMLVPDSSVNDPGDLGSDVQQSVGVSGDLALTLNDEDPPIYGGRTVYDGRGHQNFEIGQEISSQAGKFPTNGPVTNEYSNVRGLNSPLEELQLTRKQLVDAENKIVELQLQIDKMRANPRKVTHITVYYDDSTFEMFCPKGS